MAELLKRTLLLTAQLKLRKMGRERVFGAVEKVWRNTRNVRPEVIEREVDAAVRAVRSRSSRKKA